MKNKYIFLLLSFLLNLASVSIANEVYFESDKVSISDNGNIIEASKGTAKSIKGGINITADQFYYNKGLSILKANNNATARFPDRDIIINANNFIYNENLSTLEAIGNVVIKNLATKVTIKTTNIFYDIKKQKINSKSDTVINDDFGNTFLTKNFIYTLNDSLIKLNQATITDNNKNSFQISKAYINLISNKLIGKDVSIDFNNKYFSKNNDPRLKGKTISSDENETIVKNGVFTTCKKNDDCPPWKFKAKEIRHDKKSQTIHYTNAWLNIYDTPVFYFPKFFHPDPTVKRKSGFLMPTFESSTSLGTSFNLPYFYAISNNKDLTFKPRLYSNDKILLQSEYRTVNAKSKHTLDFSVVTEKNESAKSHFFSNSNTILNFENFEETQLNFQLQAVSSDAYLKSYKLKSPIINDSNVLTSSIGVSAYKEDLTINADFYAYENLSKKNNDRYEFVYPSYNLSKNLNLDNNLDGNFLLNSSGYSKNYNTNIYEKVIINDFVFNSFSKFSNNGIKNDFKFLIKNINTDSKNSTKYRTERDYKLTSIFEYNTSYPLQKKNNQHINSLKPMMSFKFSPNKSYGIRDTEGKINIDNIFNINRIMNNETIEEGASLTYGAEYKNIDTTKNKTFSTKIANILRVDDSENLPNNNQLGDKISNIFGSLNYDVNKVFEINYDYALDSNLKDTSFQNLSSKIKINNFVTSFDYLNENNTTSSNSYIANNSSFKFNDSSNFTFATRKDKKTKLTEFYNLMYQYRNDCLIAAIEYNRDYYTDKDLKPGENIFFKLTIVPFGETKSPNLK